MTLMIDNQQDLYDVKDMEKLVYDVYMKVMELHNINIGCQVSVIFTGNTGIQSINRDFRKIDSPTDVLSFPMLEYERNEIFNQNSRIEDMDMDTGEIVLGDIVISLERAYEQSVEYGHSFSREVSFLMAHGMLHLLGYDHEEESDRDVMREKEEMILGMLNMRR